MTIQAVIFDMDGTILDTIDDLTSSLNHSLGHFGYYSDFTTEEAKRFFCNGAKAAVASALREAGAPTNDSNVDAVLSFYKPYYAAHSAVKTGPYPGILELLKKLSSSGISTAVVSNKPDPAVQKLCKTYFPGMFTFALGEVRGIRRKPAADMVKACLQQLDVPSQSAVYIGDSEVDILTAKNAGLPCICVDWGFRERDELADADMIVSNCNELYNAIIG